MQSKNGTVLGSVFNDAQGPTGLNLASSDSQPTNPNLVVSFLDGNILAQDAKFSPPYVGVGGLTLVTISQGKRLLIDFMINVEEGMRAEGQSDIWSLDLTSGGKLSAALTNAYYSEVDLVIVYDPSDNRLYFTETPEAIIDPLIPVSMYLTQVS